MRQPLSSEEIRLLTEVGMVLAGAGRLAPAVSLFEALEGLRPTRAFPYVGKAMALLNGGRGEEACQCLRRAQECVGEELPTIEAFLGLSLHLTGHSNESIIALERAAAADPAMDGVRMARRMLGLDPAADDPPSLFSLHTRQGVE